MRVLHYVDLMPLHAFTIVAPSLRLTFVLSLVFFFNDTATTEIYTLSLHDALPISAAALGALLQARSFKVRLRKLDPYLKDRKSTRLNSSHTVISYAVFCLKKKKNHRLQRLRNELAGASEVTYPDSKYHHNNP